MIFNLVEAAQEFLSRIEPIAKPTESVSLLLLAYYFLSSYYNYSHSFVLLLLLFTETSNHNISVIEKKMIIEISIDVL